MAFWEWVSSVYHSGCSIRILSLKCLSQGWMTGFLITLEEKTAAVSNAHVNHGLLDLWNNFVNKITSMLQEPWLGDNGFVWVLLSPSTSLIKPNWNPKLVPKLSSELSSTAVFQPRDLPCRGCLKYQACVFPWRSWGLEWRNPGLTICVPVLGADTHPCYCWHSISVLPWERLGTYHGFLSPKMLL